MTDNSLTSNTNDNLFIYLSIGNIASVVLSVYYYSVHYYTAPLQYILLHYFVYSCLHIDYPQIGEWYTLWEDIYYGIIWRGFYFM